MPLEGPTPCSGCIVDTGNAVLPGGPALSWSHRLGRGLWVPPPSPPNVTVHCAFPGPGGQPGFPESSPIETLCWVLSTPPQHPLTSDPRPHPPLSHLEKPTPLWSDLVHTSSRMGRGPHRVAAWPHCRPGLRSGRQPLMIFLPRFLRQRHRDRGLTSPPPDRAPHAQSRRPHPKAAGP